MAADESSRVLVARIAQAMMGACPAGWQRAQVCWRQVGRRLEYEGAAVGAEGAEVALSVPAEVVGLFGELRYQQYSARTGPWFSARVRLAHPDRFALDTDAGEPQFNGVPIEVADYVHDVAALPRSEAARPQWLRGILDAEGVAQQVERALHTLKVSTATVVFRNSSAPDLPADGWVVSRNAGRWWARSSVGQPQDFGTARAAAAYAVGHVALLTVRPTSTSTDEVFRAGLRIDALAGEPPLTLFRDLRLLVVRAGTLLDRLGTPEGNVTYLAGTPSPMRSLPPHLLQQRSTVYRVRRPVEALVGEAVAWFGQPGGGTAFVLPRSLDELLRAGVLEDAGS